MKCPKCDADCISCSEGWYCLPCRAVYDSEAPARSVRTVKRVREAVKKPAEPSELERTLDFQLRAYGDCGEWVQEFAFHSGRRFRFDFCWPGLKLAAELEGGTRGNGRHNRHEGFEQDCEKYNLALLGGYRVLRFTSDMVKDGRAIATIRKALVRLQEEHQCNNP